MADLEEVYSNLDRAQIFRDMEPEEKGNYYLCRCPGCGQKRAYIYKSRKTLVCNRRNECGFTITIWDYVSEQIGGDGRATFAELARMAGMEVPISLNPEDRKRLEARKREKQEKERIRADTQAAVVESIINEIPEDESFREVITQLRERGILGKLAEADPLIRRGLIRQIKDRFGWNMPDEKALEQEIKALTEPTEEELQGKRETQAETLIGITQAEAELFHNELGEPYARLSIEGHREIWRCRTKGFRRWLVGRMWVAHNKVPNSEATSMALSVIEAKACYEGNAYKLSNRVAQEEGVIWYDLADKRWRAVRITAEGWSIEDNPPILFTRYAHQQEQAEPVHDGDPHRLLDFVNVNDEDMCLLLLVYAVTCFISNIPHPVPILHGPQGSGKSSVFRVLRRLIDPSAIEVLSFPRDVNELIQKLSHHWVALFDNVTTLQIWQSDALCRAVTGEGFSKRQLYTDDDDIIYNFRRCVGLNGINVAATRADLLDRSILIGLDRIPPDQRREEVKFWSSFEAARPEILGGIFDTLSRAMAILPHIQVAQLPRMADFARWGCAIAEALGHSADEFLRAYDANIRAQNEEVLHDHAVASAVLALIEKGDEWSGTPSELLQTLEQTAEEQKIDTRAKSWPKAPNVLTRRLNEVRTNLADAGIAVEVSRSAKRTITILRSTQKTVETVEPSNSIGIEQITPRRYFYDHKNTVAIPSKHEPLRDKGYDDIDGIDDKIRIGGEENAEDLLEVEI